MVRREREDLMEISPSTPFYCTVLDSRRSRRLPSANDSSPTEHTQKACDTIEDVDTCGLWSGKAVTSIEPAGSFWEVIPAHLIT